MKTVNLQGSETSDKNVQSNVVITKGLPKFIKNENSNDKARIKIETEEGTAILFATDLEFLKNADMEQVLNSLEPSFMNCEMYSVIESTISDEINCRVALQVFYLI